MNSFTIQPELQWFTNPTTNARHRGNFINKSHEAFYHSDYSGGGQWSVPGTIENMIWTLKNDVSPFPHRLESAKQQLSEIILNDLPDILLESYLENLVVCVIPRSKRENYYRLNQLFFRQVISDVVSDLDGFINGTKYIIRHTDTRTTHLNRNGNGGNGSLPYPGITNDTCHISENVVDKNILLIDDLYTENINIDEDAIQALLDKGANSVIFYSIGKTMPRNVILTPPPSLPPLKDDDVLPF